MNIPITQKSMHNFLDDRDQVNDEPTQGDEYVEVTDGIFLTKEEDEANRRCDEMRDNEIF